MTQLVFNGAVLDSSGYSHSGRLYILGLVDNGVNVKIINQPGNYEDFLSCLGQHEANIIRECIQKPIESSHIYYNRTPWNVFRPLNTAQKQIATSLWEAAPLPRSWVNGINNSNIDMVLTHSKFNSNLFENETNKPVGYVREGLNLELYKDFPTRRPIHDTFNFLSVFQWVERKGYDILLHAFFREFNDNDNVSLIIKTNSLDYNIVPSSNILSYISQFRYYYKKNLNLYVQTTIVDDRDILNLYRNAHCFVLPTRGEGVCRPALEVMACNLPIIITNWSGQLDFLNQDNAYLIDYSLQPVNHQWYAGEFDPSYISWAEPDVAHLQQLMRHVYENYDEAQQKARRAKEVANTYDYKIVGNELKNVLFS